MSERTDKALSDYAAAQAASYIKEYCDAQKSVKTVFFTMRRTLNFKLVIYRQKTLMNGRCNDDRKRNKKMY
jgi:hypothetical protein